MLISISYDILVLYAPLIIIIIKINNINNNNALVRATNVCIRGSRTKWQSLGLEDGAAVPIN